MNFGKSKVNYPSNWNDDYVNKINDGNELAIQLQHNIWYFILSTLNTIISFISTPH